MTQLYMPRVVIVPTLKCNLRCKLCSTYSPYYAEPYYPSMDYYFECVDRYFNIVQKVGIVSLTGGEALIRNDLHEIVDHVSIYKERIGRLDIVTNGTIIPSDALVESLRQFGAKLKVIVDNYGINVSRNAAKVFAKFQAIPDAEVINRDYFSESLFCNGWVDYGISLKSHNNGEAHASLVFKKCSQVNKMRLCVSMVDGILYPCSHARRATELGLIPRDPNESIDLFDKSHTDDEIRSRIAAWYTRKEPFSACAYCNGLCDDSPRYAPAEQLP